MLNEINDLWYNYFMDVILKKTDKEKELYKIQGEKEKELRATLNHQQIELLEEYQSSADQINMVTEKHAFAKGVKFTTRFFIEALCED